MHTARIAQHLNVQSMKHGTGFRALGIRGDSAALDPYLMVDHYWMSQPTFGAHPHAGFSAVTYMFDDAETGFHNRDSRGDSSLIRAGDLHWTAAGAGVVHDEVPVELGKTAHGLQLFVNLAAAKKHMAPAAIHVERERMPVVRQAGGATVKVAFGAYDDGVQRHDAVVELPTQATLLDVRMSPGQSFAYPITPGSTAFLLVIKGTIRIDGQDLHEAKSVGIDRAGGELRLTVATDVQLALFLGQPLNEPVVRQGPFAMTTQADIARAVADFQAGRMGRL